MKADDLLAGPRLTASQIVGVAAGNGLEFYDFLTYTFFAAQIGRTMFPQTGGFGLLLSLATFGVGFLTRPLGGLVIGRLADRRGRKPAMLLSFGLMGAGLLGLVLTPSYASIGLAAPVLVVLFRLLQGFALGGEVGPNTAFLLEAAPIHRRGLYVSFQTMTQDGAVLFAGTVGLVLSLSLTPAQLDEFGWRIAFLVGAAIIPFGLAVRRSLTETLFQQGKAPPLAAGAERHAYRVTVACGLLMLGATAIAAYSLSYLATYGEAVLHMPAQIAFESVLAYGVTAVIVDPLFGWFADRFGRKRTMTIPWLLLILYIVPSFSLLSAFPTTAVFVANTAVLTVMVAGIFTASNVLFIEALPAHMRAGSFGLVYALAIALFGGSAQVIEHGLVGWTHNAAAPSWYMAGVLVIGFIAMRLMPEHGQRQPVQG